MCYNKDMLEVDEYFKSYYLNCGKTRDNFLFENCPKELVLYARQCLSEPKNNVKPCVVTIMPKLENDMEKIFSQCKDDLQKSFFARDLVCSIIMCEMLKGDKMFEQERVLFYDGIRCILRGDFEKAKEYHIKNAPMPYEVSQIVGQIGKIEIDIFLLDTNNKFIQQAINNFVSSREKYSVKVFTTNKTLPSYRDQLGNFIQSPHDYMAIDVNKYVKLNENVKN